MIIVIGSGPAGVSAARALLDRGREVLLLDAGVEMEPERRAIAAQLASTPRDAWPEPLLAEARRQSPVELGGVPLKYTFGSSFPYQQVDRVLPFENRGCATRPTLARGGFSSVWGAAVLPYLAEDLEDWPISAADLAPHYRAVTSWMPLAGVEDDLADELPLHTTSHPLEPSPQAVQLLADLDRNRDRLRRAGLRFGRSRLAVRSATASGGPACAYCQMCMHGCPWGLIYDAGATLDELRRRGLRYEPGVVVDRLDETSGAVTILGRSLGTGAPLRFRADRVYVACGALGSTRLLLASLDAFDRPVVMKDSQYFLLPLLRLRSAGRARRQAIHTLAQAFLELRDPAICDRNVHLQIYGYNDLYAGIFERVLGGLARVALPLLDPLLSRLLVIQGYLHSDLSPSIRVQLERGKDVDRLVLETQENPLTRPILRRVVGRLVRHAPDLRALPLAPLLRVALAGRGFHSGGTFPMRRAPGAFETDALGRPAGFSRVHVVDATVFPTIPSTTITFTVMANAHRIASADV